MNFVSFCVDRWLSKGVSATLIWHDLKYDWRGVLPHQPSIGTKSKSPAFIGTYKHFFCEGSATFYSTRHDFKKKYSPPPLTMNNKQIKRTKKITK